MFATLAALFLAFTVLMVIFVMVLGYLEWRDDRALHATKVASQIAKAAR